MSKVGDNSYLTTLNDVMYVDGAQLSLLSHSQLEKQVFDLEYRRGAHTFRVWWDNRFTMTADLNHEGMFRDKHSSGE